MKKITNKELVDAVSKINAIIKSPQKIKDVRARYTTGSIVTIEQDRRAEFIADILYLLHTTRSKLTQ